MADQIQPLTISLEELRKILARREKASLDLAARSTTPRFGKASRDEAAFFGGLRLLVDEVQVARSRIHGDPSRPVSDSEADELSPYGVDRLLSEINGHHDDVPLPISSRS